MKLKDAIETGIDKVQNNCWVGGVIIVYEDDEGEDGYDTIPGAYLSDISYDGSRNKIYEFDKCEILDYINSDDHDGNLEPLIDYIESCIND